MVRLNKKNYFSPSNQNLTNSRIGDWLKCKRFFFELHIAGNRTKETTDSMLFGKAVDMWLTEGKEKFLKNFIGVERRNKNNTHGLIELNNTVYEQIVALCSKVELTDAYKSLKGHKRQVLLKQDLDLGRFKGIAGILDFLKVDKKNNRAIITDLKTTTDISPTKYFFTCKTYRYFSQLGVYGLLVQNKYGIKDIEYRHLAIQKDPDGIYSCQTFIFDKDLIEYEIAKTFDILKDISAEKDFLPNNASWDKAVVISGRKEEKEEVEI